MVLQIYWKEKETKQFWVMKLCLVLLLSERIYMLRTYWEKVTAVHFSTVQCSAGQGGEV